MRLGEFIQQHRKKIIEEWIDFARTLQPWSTDMSKRDLRDHAEELLDAIVSDMGAPQSGRQQSEKSKGHQGESALSDVGKKHAIDRLETGLKLDQLVSEYRALRASVLRLWEAAQPEKDDELTRFNEAIDETLAEAAVWYSDKMVHTRDQFLAILGHDLRNPLGSIVLGAGLLARSQIADVKQLGIATRIVNSANRMDRMVGDLLDLTRTRLGSGIPVTPMPMDLEPLCREVIAELEAIDPDNRLQFEAKGDLQGAWDRDRLAQVLSNLLANALQYGRDDAPVKVAAHGGGDDVVIRVQNAGRPISEAAMKTMFEPMTREPADQADKNASGLGLGLYIAREVVIAHGGSITVTSTEKDGTTFSVQLPRRAAKKRAAVVK